MEEGQNYPTQVSEGGGGGGSALHSGLNFAVIKTPSGLMMIVNIILLFLAWVIMAGWRGAVGALIYENIETGMQSFFLFSTVFPWLLLIVLLIILLFGIHTRITLINWPLTLVINCCIWAFFLLVSSSLVADKSGKHLCSVWKCDSLRAAAAFGFFSMFGLLAEAFFHFREFRAP